MSFQRAERKKIKLKLAITGPSGSGKTYSALRLAAGLGKKVALIDTENGSASLYSDRFNFDTLELQPPYQDGKFINAINDAISGGYDVLIIDSASHFWEGLLEYKSKLDTRPGSNSYTNWNEAGNKFKGILSAVLHSPIHVICCMRSKMDYVLETNERGKQVPKKIGLAPIMRDGIEYEFTTVLDIDLNHQAQSSKDRTGMFKDDVFQVTEKTGQQFSEWLNKGIDAPEKAPPVVEQFSNKVATVTGEVQNSRPKWAPEQSKEYGEIRQEIVSIDSAADQEVLALNSRMKYDQPSDVIEAMKKLLAKWRDIEDQNNHEAASPANNQG